VQDGVYLDRIARHIDAGAEFQKISALFDEVAPRMRILDCGCSGGTVTSLLAGSHFVVGMDLLRPMLVEAAGRGLRPVHGDASRPLPFRDAAFDLVIMGDVLEHLVDPEQLVREAWRVLAPGGRAIASVPNYYSIIRRFRFLRGKSLVINSHEPYRSYNYFHLRFFTLQDFEELFERTGFRILKRSYKWTGICSYEDRHWRRWWNLFHRVTKPFHERLANRRPMLFSHEFGLLAERPRFSGQP